MKCSDRPGMEVFEGEVRSEWIDVNGHMNVAYYVLAFDFGTDALWGRFGITSEYIETTRGSTFAVESHINYRKEMLQGQRYVITTQILAYDEKRIHQFQYMYHAEAGYLAATAEWMNLYVDLNSRRVGLWPEHILKNIQKIAHGQVNETRPADAGQQMAIKSPLYNL